MRRCDGLLLKSVLIVSLIALAPEPLGRAQTSQLSDPVDNVSKQSSSVNKPALPLQGTAPIIPALTGDIREEQHQQIIRYVLEQITATPARRDKLWQPDFSSLAAYQASVQEHRKNLRALLGLIQPKLNPPQIRILEENKALRIEDVTLPIDADLSTRALVFVPRSASATVAVIAIPPENQSREEFAGIAQGMRPSRWLTVLLEQNIPVAIPAISERRDDHPICRQAGGKDRRRVLWRAGFIVGRTLAGMEVQQVLALREFLRSRRDINVKHVAVMGERQGGMIAFYAGAVDEQFAGVATLDYFQQRESGWTEPVDRVLYGQLNEFGDAEVAALITPRPLWIITKPGGLVSSVSVKDEYLRAVRFYDRLKSRKNLNELEVPGDALEVAAMKLASVVGSARKGRTSELALQISPTQIEETRNRNFESMFAYLQNLHVASQQVRTDYWQLNSTTSQDRPLRVQKLQRELADLIGEIPSETMPIRARTALIGETDKFLAYNVLLDVVPGVEVYGHLLVPRAVAGRVGRRLPAVVCQHGFDGEPKYVSGVGSQLEANDHFYHRFGQRLAERGYVVFAPYLSVPEDHHPPNIVHRADLINPLVRMMASLGMMRTSIELAKLHRVVDFLQSLSFVEPDRIGYYGLSYGGYSALWMAPLEKRLKAIVISAHFNDWQTMLTDTKRYGDSYWTLPDEDFYNWNVLNRFVHTQIIASMWPRPVCIEYGSGDPVTTPEWHERAWNELSLFSDSWNLKDNLVDDQFEGPHAIHGMGTFFFLDRWLRPENGAGRDYGCGNGDYCNKNIAPDFHGYLPLPKDSVPYATQMLDKGQSPMIRGSFYVSRVSTVFAGMALKLARNGNPGDLVIKFGSSEGSADLGEARISSMDVHPQFDLWYEAELEKPVQLDPKKCYFFEITTTSGQAPLDCYTVFGPKPLGGTDKAPYFGLSFLTLTRKDE